MAAENAQGLATQVPEAIQYVAWVIITVVGGLAVRFGWTTAKGSTATTAVEVAGGVVDNRAVKALTDSIDEAVDKMEHMHRERVKFERVQTELIESLGEDVRTLTRTLGKVFEKLA